MIRRYILSLVFLIVSSLKGFSQPLVLDTSYGVQGLNNTTVSCETSLFLDDNTVVVPYKLSPSYGFSLPAVGIRKFNTDGTLDTTFGTNGIGLYTPTNQNDRFDIYGITAQPDGKFVIVGQTYAIGGFAYYYNFFLLRFNANGTPDTTFGTNALVKYSMNTFNQEKERFLEVAIDSNNRILAVGYTEADIDTKMNAVAMCFLPNGTIDTSFGTNGVLQLSLAGDDIFNHINILADNSILLTGATSLSASNQDIILAKIDGSGNYDTTFGTNGTTYVDFDLGIDSVSKLFFKPNNKIMLVGTSTINTLSARAAFVQLNSNGTLDTSFSTDGKNTIYIPVPNHYNIGAANVALLPDNKFIITSTTKRNDDSSNNYDYAVARVNENTTLDTSFATNGVYVNVMPQTHDYARAVYVQDDGKPLVVVNGTIYRYQNTSVLSTNDYDNNKKSIIFPNPFKDRINIEGNFEVQKIEVLNIDGKILNSYTNKSKELDLSHLPGGIYLLKIESAETTYIEKIIKN